MKKTDSGVFLLLHLLMLLYACASAMQKLAARYAFLSLGFLLCYAGVAFFLGLYALGWQQAIKRLPLGVAFAHKAFTYVWMMLIGALFFRESIRPKQVVGCAVLIAGVLLFVRAEGEEAGDDA